MKGGNIALIGMPGSGKTSIGRAAALLCGLAFVDTDEMIEEKHDKISRLFEISEEYFRDIETQIVRAASQRQNAVISTGGGCVLKEENMAALKQSGRVVYIFRPLQKIISDIEDADRPLIKGKSGALVELYRQRKALFETYADYTLLNAGTMEDAVQELARYIKEVHG